MSTPSLCACLSLAVSASPLSAYPASPYPPPYEAALAAVAVEAAETAEKTKAEDGDDDGDGNADAADDEDNRPEENVDGEAKERRQGVGVEERERQRERERRRKNEEPEIFMVELVAAGYSAYVMPSKGRYNTRRNLLGVPGLPFVLCSELLTQGPKVRTPSYFFTFFCSNCGFLAFRCQTPESVEPFFVPF